MWSDAIWTGREECLRRMSKGVLQTNWYYRSDFSPKKLAWNAEFEKKGITKVVEGIDLFAAARDKHYPGA